tara:strand:- start:2510 stop:3661 length:1152 start_codon:yes stop_codon:yes gene_type:complete
MRQFKLDKIKATGTTIGDANFSKVKLLLPFDGSNGATSTSDSSNDNASITFQGSATIATAQSKFGGSSLYATNANPDGIVSQIVGASLNLTADFTIEWWIRRVQVSVVDNMMFGPMYGASSSTSPNNAMGLACGYFYNSSSSTKIGLYAASGSGSWDISAGNLICDLPTVGAWEHHALVRSGSDWSYYVDGSRTYNASLGSSTLYSQSTPSYITLGKSWSTVASPEAYYDDFRVTQGLARYSGTSFTPPSTAHLTSAGDGNKQIVLNSDADGVAIGTDTSNRVAKAWVNFEGTDTSNIRGSYNVSSISDRGTGLFTVNFSTAMTDANYAVNATSGHGSDTATTATARTGGTISTTACHISTGYRSSSSVLADMDYNAVTFFGN